MRDVSSWQVNLEICSFRNIAIYHTDFQILEIIKTLEEIVIRNDETLILVKNTI